MSRERQLAVADDRIVQILPNASLSPRGALYFFMSVAGATVLVSGSAVAAGYWPVLPFAGAELLLLGLVLRRLQRRARYREVVRISADKIVVEKGENRVQERLEFQRHWSQVQLRRSRAGNHLSHLWIMSQGRGCEIGRCLTETERIGLARRLREFIGPVNVSPELA